MKKNFPKMLLFLLIAVLALALAACNPEGSGTPGTSDTTDPVQEKASFTVTFDSNGGTSLADFNTTVEFGQTVTAPSVTPVKTGYVFAGWLLNNTATAYDFDNYTITENTTIKASWTAKTYDHTVHLTDERLKSNISDIGAGQTVAEYYGTQVSLTNSTGDTLTTLTTSYNATSALLRPATVKVGDRFIAWYYYDGDKIVYLNTFLKAGSTATEVNLSEKFLLDKNLDIYAMWYSCLPKVTVTYDSTGGSSVAAAQVKLGDALAEPTAPTLANYEFDGWYYEITKDEVTEKKDFIFDITSSDTDTPDTLEGDVTLKARWMRKIDVSAQSDFSALIAALSDENSDNDAEYLGAHIYIKNDLTLSGWTALFTESKPFTGKLDGGVYDDGGILTGKRTVTINGMAGNTLLSFLGASDGMVKNLTVSMDLSLIAAEDGVQTIYAAPVASLNTGDLSNVNTAVTGSVDVDVTVVFGGLIAENNGGEIYDSSAIVTLTKLDATTLFAGGLVGRNMSGPMKNSAANFTVTSNAETAYVGGVAGQILGGTFNRDKAAATLTVSADNAYLGGFVGHMSAMTASEIYVSSATINATADTVLAGGAVGDNWGVISDVQIDSVNVTSSATVLNECGGIAGRNYNEGGTRAHVKYSVVKSGTVNASATGDGIVRAGGVVGHTYGGQIFKLYANVNVTVASEEESSIGYAIGLSNASSATSYNSVYTSLTAALTLNSVAYDKTERNFTITENAAFLNPENADTHTTAAFYKTVLAFNPNYETIDPDVNDLLWTISEGAMPSLTFTVTP